MSEQQQATQPQELRFTFGLTQPQLQLVIKGLGKLTYDESSLLITAFIEEYKKQRAEREEEAQKAAKEQLVEKKVDEVIKEDTEEKASPKEV